MSDLSVQSLSGTPTAGEMSVSEGDASSDIGLGEKPRRKRTVITPDQLDKLETSFKQEPWPHRSRKENIAKDLDKPEPFVSIWFQNKRARVKREEEMAKQGLQHDQKVKGSYSDENKAPPPVLGFPDDSLPKKRIISVEDNKGNRYVKLLEICKPEDNFRDIVSRSLIEQRESQRSPVNINLSEKSVSKEVSHCGGGEGGAVTTKVSWSVPVAMTETSAGGGRTGSTSRPTTSSSTSTSSSSSRPTSSSTTSSGTTTSCNVASRPAPAVAVKHRSTTDQAAKHISTCSPAQITPGGMMEGRRGPHTLFHAIVNMMAVCEGGIVQTSHPDFQSAVNDALYGIMINGSSRIVYDKILGLDLVDLPADPSAL